MYHTFFGKAEVGMSISYFAGNICIPNAMHSEGYTEQMVQKSDFGTFPTVEDLGTLMPLAYCFRKCNWYHQNKILPQDSVSEGYKNIFGFWISMRSRYLFSNIV